MDLPLPEIDEVNRPYWDGLTQGVLRIQRCRACGKAWLPPREACPGCLAADPEWVQASGEATLVSWVVYHKAYHDAFRDRVPYNVAVVELAEGARLMTNIVAPNDTLSIGMPLRLKVELDFGLALPRFAPA